MLQDYHLYHDSLNNKVLLSSNRQKQALFDKYIIAQIPGNITSWIQRCHESEGRVGTLYPTSNISRLVYVGLILVKLKILPPSSYIIIYYMLVTVVMIVSQYLILMDVLYIPLVIEVVESLKVHVV